MAAKYQPNFTPIFSLPHLPWLAILEYLDIKDISSLKQTCTHLNQIITNVSEKIELKELEEILLPAFYETLNKEDLLLVAKYNGAGT